MTPVEQAVSGMVGRDAACFVARTLLPASTLYQPPQTLTCAQERRVMEAIRSGVLISVDQAWQHASTMAS